MSNQLNEQTPVPEEVGGQPPRGRKRRFYGLLVFLALLFVLGAGLTAYVHVVGGLRNALASLPLLGPPDLTKVFGKDKLRVLVLGIDENWTEKDIMYTANARSDTMMAVSIDLSTKNVGILSIPRDTWVEIPKVGFAKINEAYADAGPQRAERTVEKNFGVPPFDYYVVLRIDATKNLVDAIGGIDVAVEKDMDYDDGWGHLHIHLKKGYQHLDGEHAVGYVRYRHDAEGDFGRMRRQRQVIQVLSHRLKDPSIVFALPSLVATVFENVRTDMPRDRMFALALGMRDVSPQMVHAAQLPVNVGWTNGQSVLFADQTQTAAIVRKYLIAGFGGGFDPSSVHVTVQNGSGTPGAASAMAAHLRKRGFTVVGTGNAKSFDHAKTTVTGTDRQMAGEVAKQLPVHNAQIAVGPVEGGDIEIVIGRDYRIQ